MKNKLLISALALSLMTPAITFDVQASETNPDAYVKMSDEDIAKYLSFTKVGGGYLVGQTEAGKLFTGELHIPATHLGEPVIGVPLNAFFNAKVTKLIFEKPEQITSIGVQSFRGIKVSNVMKFPNLTEIPLSAFQEVNLELVINPNKINNIGQSSFLNASLKTELKLTNIREIPESAFYGTNVPKLILNKDIITYIGMQAFKGFNSPETEIEFSLVKELLKDTFYGASLKKLILSDNLVTVGTNSLSGISLSTNGHGYGYVFVPDRLKTAVSGPTYFGYLDKTKTPLGINLELGGIFTQHKIVMTPLLQSGATDTNKQVKTITEPRTLLYAGTDFDYNTRYSIDIYPLLNNENTKITIPMEPFQEHVALPIDLKITQGQLGMELINPDRLKLHINLNNGVDYAEVPITSTVRVKDFRGNGDPWTLSVATTDIEVNGETMEGIQFTSKGLTVDKVTSTNQFTDETGLEYENIKPNDNLERSLSQNSIPIGSGSFGVYDHKMDTMKVQVDPRKLNFSGDETELNVTSTLLWTIATEL